MDLDYHDDVELQYHDNFEGKKPQGYLPPPRRSGFPKFTILIITAIFLAVIGIVNFSSLQAPIQQVVHVIQHDSHGSHPCKDPIVRKEWRVLNSREKEHYLKSIRCLWDKPSRLGLDHSLLEDFSWAHSRMGNFSHDTPAFIAWHRYFLDIYEKTLQNDCGYKGHLVYWDWSLDWEDMTKSPIFDGRTGFGGNGDINSNASVGGGHCVTDGPFRNRIVQMFGEEYIEHCFSRGFANASQLELRFGRTVHPDAVERLLAVPDYETFNQALEDGPHNAIPAAIRGDFLRFTSPYDPIFFLHHVQLDRVWWLWQKRDPRHRTLQYSDKEHTLDDVFRFHGFAPDRKVLDNEPDRTRRRILEDKQVETQLFYYNKSNISKENGHYFETKCCYSVWPRPRDERVIQQSRSGHLDSQRDDLEVDICLFGV